MDVVGVPPWLRKPPYIPAAFPIQDMVAPQQSPTFTAASLHADCIPIFSHVSWLIPQRFSANHIAQWFYPHVIPLDDVILSYYCIIPIVSYLIRIRPFDIPHSISVFPEVYYTILGVAVPVICGYIRTVEAVISCYIPTNMIQWYQFVLHDIRDVLSKTL